LTQPKVDTGLGSNQAAESFDVLPVYSSIIFHQFEPYTVPNCS